MWVLVPVSGDDKVSGNVYVRVIYRKRHKNLDQGHMHVSYKGLGPIHVSNKGWREMSNLDDLSYLE